MKKSTHSLLGKKQKREAYGIGGLTKLLKSAPKLAAEMKLNKGSTVDPKMAKAAFRILDEDFADSALLKRVGKDVDINDIDPTTAKSVIALKELQAAAVSKKPTKLKYIDELFDEDMSFDEFLELYVVDDLVGTPARMTKAEGGESLLADDMAAMESLESKDMEDDDKMEDNFTNYILEQALSEEEEEMLMNELEDNPDLSMLFDKVMDVAQEFSGSGSVEGPGSEVSDSIPARLSDGEFVFTAKAVEEIGADTLMSMMKEAEAKADGRQEVAEGGTVTTTVTQNEDEYNYGVDPEEDQLRNAAVSQQMRNLNPRMR